MSMENPRISVVMPVYNTPAEFLRASVDSILAQTFPDFEFIIVNDGSTDPQVESVIGSYSDPRIRYCTKPNSGISDTLNFGIKRAKGEFIARMDADDISLPERFERQLAFLDANWEIAACGTWIEKFPTGEVVRLPPRFGLWELALDGCQMAHPTVMFRRDVFARNHLSYDSRFDYAEDYELWTRASLVLRMANVTEVLLRYRVNPKGITQSRSDEQLAKTKEVRDRILEFIGFDIAAYRHVNRPEGARYVTRLRTLGLPVAKVVRNGGVSVLWLFHAIPLVSWKVRAEGPA